MKSFQILMLLVLVIAHCYFLVKAQDDNNFWNFRYIKLITLYRHAIFWGQRDRGEVPQLNIVPIVSCFKRQTCLFLSIMIEVTIHPRLKPISWKQTWNENTIVAWSIYFSHCHYFCSLLSLLMNVQDQFNLDDRTSSNDSMYNLSLSHSTG